jgi:hypothetical protein
MVGYIVLPCSKRVGLHDPDLPDITSRPVRHSVYSAQTAHSMPGLDEALPTACAHGG